jgi:hypothetical protein
MTPRISFMADAMLSTTSSKLSLSCPKIASTGWAVKSSSSDINFTPELACGLGLEQTSSFPPLWISGFLWAG